MSHGVYHLSVTLCQDIGEEWNFRSICRDEVWTSSYRIWTGLRPLAKRSVSRPSGNEWSENITNAFSPHLDTNLRRVSSEAGSHKNCGTTKFEQEPVEISDMTISRTVSLGEAFIQSRNWANSSICKVYHNEEIVLLCETENISCINLLLLEVSIRGSVLLESLILQRRFMKNRIQSRCRGHVFFLLMGWDWVHLVRRPLFGLLYQPQVIDDDDCGAMGGIRIGRGNRSTRRKPAPVPLCPPQFPHDLTRSQTRAAALGSRQLTSWAMARPRGHVTPTT
jgi:hypothetical protein